MDRLNKANAAELICRMRGEFEKVMSEVMEAVNGASDGHLIDGSEERCRDVLGEFRRRAYEMAVQMRVEATEANPSFSPSGSGQSRDSHSDGAQRLRPDGGSPAALRRSGRGQQRTGG